MVLQLIFTQAIINFQYGSLQTRCPFVVMVIQLFACVCVTKKNVHLHAYQSIVFAKRLHTALSSSLFVARDVCQIYSRTQSAHFYHFYSCNCMALCMGSPGTLSKKKLSLEDYHTHCLARWKRSLTSQLYTYTTCTFNIHLKV